MPAKRFLLAFVAVALPGAHGLAAPKTYSYADLLNRMVDLKALAELPAVGERCYQHSSYDRASKNPDDKKGWNANRDHGNYVRQDGDEYVMAEATGPGAIVRIWSANPQGTLRIYLDGSSEPVVAAPTKQITVLSWQADNRKPQPAGQQEAWVFPKPVGDPARSTTLCGRRAAGWNLYLPIPFRKSARVTVDKPPQPERLYYHVNFQTFPPETDVPTFTWALLQQNLDVLNRIRQELAAPPAEVRDLSDAEMLELPAGQAELQEFYGPAAITLLKGRVEADDLRAALRDVVLKITFDGASRPQVWAPIGDFFGTMPGPNRYDSLPMGVAPEASYSRWYMPFREIAVLELVNEGPQTVTIDGGLVTEPIDWNENLGYFHAKWRRTRKNTTFDWPILECTGRGRFVGAALGVFNPVSGWWGEGDEKVWVDGETFPSTFGTGSEDYFGYAWCNRALFIHPYHNQTLCEGPGNGNHTSVNRFHVVDSIPFQKSIRFAIEDWPLGNTIGKDYCSTAYWYADAKQKDFFEPVPRPERLPQAKWKPHKIKGLIEAETLRVTSGQDASRQEMGSFGGTWSGAAHLFWRPTGAGQALELAFPAREAGEKEVLLHLTKSWDYGQFRFRVNGTAADLIVDLYSGRQGKCVRRTPVSLGRLKIEKGTNTLRIEVAGKSEASPGYYFGLDGLMIR